MEFIRLKKPIGQLEKRRGGYYYFVVEAAVVEQLPNQRATRLLCQLDGRVSYPCGLNHLGDGNFFIILSTANLRKLGKNAGDSVEVALSVDPNPLGVAIPPVLSALLEGDPALKTVFEGLTDGKKT